MRRYLVVANQTLGGERLVEKIQELIGAGPCSFHVLVPVVPVASAVDYSGAAAAYAYGLYAPDFLASAQPESDEEAYEQARERLGMELERLRAAGAEADGEIGGPNPIEAIRVVLRREPFDELILSTLPPGISRWLRMDLPSRVQRSFDLPVTHVVGVDAE